MSRVGLRVVGLEYARHLNTRSQKVIGINPVCFHSWRLQSSEPEIAKI